MSCSICMDCPYRWKDNETDDYPHCHWESRFPDDLAPCEYDDYIEEDED